MSVMFPQDPAPQPPDSKDPDFEFKSEEQADLCLRSIITPMNVNDEDFGVYFVPKLVRIIMASLLFFLFSYFYYYLRVNMMI